MKKFLFLSTLAIICGILGAVLYKKSAQDVSVSKDYELSALPCDLMKKPCESSGIRFDISPRPINIMKKSTIKIFNLPKNFDDPKLRIHGLNMDMGTIIASLSEVAPNEFRAQVALSACVIENIMRYRISLYNGNEPTNIFADFDIER